MLDSNDLRQIKEIFDSSLKISYEGPDFKHAVQKVVKEVVKEVVDESINRALGDFWQHNLEPAFDYVHTRIDQLPTKAYVDDKIADLRNGSNWSYRDQKRK